MVERQLIARGITDRDVLAAMGRVPREIFVPADRRAGAYDDAALPIGAGQTISQPYVVALMLEAAELRSGMSVLEIGTGSGYAAAVIAQIVDRVYTVERLADLAAKAGQRLVEFGFGNVEVAVGDGTLGWPEHAPFSAILVAAGGPASPPRALQEQLAVGGRMVIPTGSSRYLQELTVFERLDRDGSMRRTTLGDVRFVPLVGSAGWNDGDD